jgi:hypothetical protein
VCSVVQLDDDVVGAGVLRIWELGAWRGTCVRDMPVPHSMSGRESRKCWSRGWRNILILRS